MTKKPPRLSNFGRAPALALSLLAVLGLGACAKIMPTLPDMKMPAAAAKQSYLSLWPKRFDKIPGWVADNQAAALPAFIASCSKIEKLPADKALGKFSEMGTVSDWLPLCKTARLIRPGNKTEAQYFFESRFLAYEVRDSASSDGLFTGYYEPDLQGAFGPDARYRFPLFAKPKDLIGANLGQFDEALRGKTIAGRLQGGRFVPYFSRAEIEDGALAGKQLETLWVDNAIDAFVLHVQGSGRVILPDGSHVRVGYGGRNGHRYTSIGRELVAAGAMRLDDVTMPAIRSWMEANPVAAQALMRKNKSFIFFKISKNAGPIGAQGVALTPGRSLAVDRAYYPMGLPIWLDSTDPGTRGEKLRRLMIAQDTGSAIKGPLRGDFFWGNGPKAAIKAGIMKEDGALYLLLPRSAGPEHAKNRPLS